MSGTQYEPNDRETRAAWTQVVAVLVVVFLLATAVLGLVGDRFDGSPGRDVSSRTAQVDRST